MDSKGVVKLICLRSWPCYEFQRRNKMGTASLRMKRERKSERPYRKSINDRNSEPYRNWHYRARFLDGSTCNTISIQHRLFTRRSLSATDTGLQKKVKGATFNTGSADIPRLFFCIQWRQSHRLEHCYRHVYFIGPLIKFTPRFRRSANETSSSKKIASLCPSHSISFARSSVRPASFIWGRDDTRFIEISNFKCITMEAIHTILPNIEPTARTANLVRS